MWRTLLVLLCLAAGAASARDLYFDSHGARIAQSEEVDETGHGRGQSADDTAAEREVCRYGPASIVGTDVCKIADE